MFKMATNFISILPTAFVMLFLCCAANQTAKFGNNSHIDVSACHATLAALTKNDSTLLVSIQNDILKLLGQERVPRQRKFTSRVNNKLKSSAMNYMRDIYKRVIADSRGIGAAVISDSDSVEDTTVAYDATTETPNYSILDGDAMVYGGTTVPNKIVTFSELGKIQVRPNMTNRSGAMYFEFSNDSETDNEQILSSELRIYFDAKQRSSQDNVFVVNVARIENHKGSHVILSSRVVNTTISIWYSFDIVNAVKMWTLDPVSNHGLLVTCKQMTGRKLDLNECGIVNLEETNSSDTLPFIVAYYNSNTEEKINSIGSSHQTISTNIDQKTRIQQRIRRSLSNLFPRVSDSNNWSSYESSGRHCRKRRLYIRFSDLGYSDWIIAPSGYQADFCKGICTFPMGKDMKATNHAMIQTLMHHVSPDYYPEPCCAPIKMQSLQVLYQNEQSNIVMKEYSNMIVKDCGCH